MKTSINHIGLVSGIIIVLLSLLFFGRQQGIYHAILVGGLLITIGCYIWILLGKESFRSKFFWSRVAIGGMASVWMIQGYFVDISYRLFLHNKNQELTSINSLLKNTPGEVWVLRESIRERPVPTLSSSAKQQLNRDFEKLGVNMILKNGNTIYYELWGFLDVRLGITYGINGRLPRDQYRHLKENWYR